MAAEPEHRGSWPVDIKAVGSPARTDPIRLGLHRHLPEGGYERLGPWAHAFLEDAMRDPDFAVRDTPVT